MIFKGVCYLGYGFLGWNALQFGEPDVSEEYIASISRVEE
jgi:hypothetical protein